MFGVPINGPSDVICDNQPAVINLSIPSFILNKKHDYTCYHRFQEAHTDVTI